MENSMNYEKKTSNFKKEKRYNRDDRNAEIIIKQTKSLEVITFASEFLNMYYADENRTNRFTIEELKDYLVRAGFTYDDFKFVNQILYLIVDLANARRYKHISPMRIAIRCLYIKERMETMFKHELHESIANMISEYSLYEIDDSCKKETVYYPDDRNVVRNDTTIEDDDIQEENREVNE